MPQTATSFLNLKLVWLNKHTPLFQMLQEHAVEQFNPSIRRTTRTAKPSQIYKDYMNSSSDVRRPSFGSKSQVQLNDVDEATATPCGSPPGDFLSEDDTSPKKVSKSPNVNVDITNISSRPSCELRDGSEVEKYAAKNVISTSNNEDELSDAVHEKVLLCYSRVA